MSFVEVLQQAHIKKHRVSHSCDKLTDAEKEVYARLKRERKRELTLDGLTARLEPKRFGVNWRRELEKVTSPEYVQGLNEKAKKRTREAKAKFEQEAPNWLDDTPSEKRLVIEG